MIAVAVRSVDRGQILSARRDPIDQRPVLVDGDEGIDKDRVPLAGDESR